jgi:feruloyl esterase
MSHHRRVHSASALVTTSIALLVAPATHGAADPQACSALSAPGTFQHTTVTQARVVPAKSNRWASFCEVTATVKPVAGSNITVVYRLPENWNGKMLSLGGGGWAGNTRLEVSPQGLSAEPGLSKGYATAQTNSGHDVDNVWETAWASNPEAATDFAYRAIHVMTDVGKQVIAKYYGKPQKHAYFHGCSTGGRQALMEVQRFPEDYDGVIAGAPVYSLTTQTMSVVRNQILAKAGSSLTEAQLKRLNQAALAACDAKDGLADGVVTDPRSCSFDPAPLQCSSDKKDDTCLTPAQVSTVRALYAGTKTSSGETVAYGLTRGSEAGWSRFIATSAPANRENFLTGPAGAGLGGLRAQVFGDPNFDLAAFNPDRDYKTVRNSRFAAEYEAKNPDISAFVNGGGKLLLWHGMDDPGPNVLATIEYYEQMKATTGPKAKNLDSSARLFVLPGVYHCAGGPGADTLDVVAAIDDWVDKGKAPSVLKATRSADPAVSRPVCQYPKLPYYSGKGDPKAAESFQCR